MKKIKVIISLVAVFYIGSAILLFFFQGKFMYQPSKNHPHSHTTQIFSIEGESLEAIVLNPNRKHAILYFGGSGESLPYTTSDFIDVFPFHSMYLINYRGYGGSSGDPSERALFTDALAVYDKLSNDYQTISVIGYSLGSGVAMHLAASRELHSVSLVAPYDSMQSVAQEFFPIYPMSIMLREKYDSISKVNQVEEDVLIILAEEDKNIPYELTHRLITAFPKNQVKIKTIENIDHNSFFDSDDYYSTLGEFINEGY